MYVYVSVRKRQCSMRWQRTFAWVRQSDLVEAQRKVPTLSLNSMRQVHQAQILSRFLHFAFSFVALNTPYLTYPSAKNTLGDIYEKTMNPCSLRYDDVGHCLIYPNWVWIDHSQRTLYSRVAYFWEVLDEKLEQEQTWGVTVVSTCDHNQRISLRTIASVRQATFWFLV